MAPLANELPQTDLTNILIQLRRKDPERWTGELLAAAELEYRRFLCLAKHGGELHLIPPPLVDEVWHQHILNTEVYGADCVAYVGQFLHHHPFNGTESLDECRSARQATLAAYRTVFGEEPGSIWADENAACDACSWKCGCKLLEPARIATAVSGPSGIQ